MKLTKPQAEHLYELAYDNLLENCFECYLLKSRLEKYIGEKEVKQIKRMLKKHPYIEYRILS